MRFKDEKVVIVQLTPSNRKLIAEWEVYKSSKGKGLYFAANQTDEEIHIPVEDVMSITQGPDRRVWFNCPRGTYGNVVKPRTGWVSELVGSNRGGDKVIDANYKAFLASVHIVEEPGDDEHYDDPVIYFPKAAKAKEVATTPAVTRFYLCGLPEVESLVEKIALAKVTSTAQVKTFLSALSGSGWSLGLEDIQSKAVTSILTFSQFHRLMNYDDDPQLLTVVRDLVKTHSRLVYWPGE
jgi:hypothetical protein